MRKKFLLIVMTLCLIFSCTFLFTACGGDSEKAKETGFNVYLNEQKVTTDATLTFDYSPTLADTWKTNVRVEKVMSNGNTATLNLNEFTFEGVPATLDANETGYTISVKYLDFSAISFKLIINKALVARPTANDYTSYVYDASTGYEGAETGQDLDAKYTLSTETGFSANTQINAGDYATKFILNPNYKWSTEVSGSQTEPHVVNWSVAKQTVYAPYIQSSDYDGTNKLPYVETSTLYKMSETQEQTEYITAKTYKIKLELLDKQNYKWNNDSSEDILVDYSIVASSSNQITNVSQSAEVYYGDSLQGANPLKVAISSTFGSDGDFTAILKQNNIIVAQYKKTGDLWQLLSADGSSNLVKLDAGTYDIIVTITATDNYPQAVSSPTTIYVRPQTIPTSAYPELKSDSTIGLYHYLETYDGASKKTNLVSNTYFAIEDTSYVDAGIKYYTLTANANYCFRENPSNVEGDSTKEIILVIQRTTNTITAPSITGWAYGEYSAQTNAPTATIKFGNASYYIKKTGEDDSAYVEFTLQNVKNLAPANYTVKIVTEGTDNYDSATETLTFNVTKLSINSSSLSVVFPYDYYVLKANSTWAPQDVEIKYNGAKLDNSNFILSVVPESEGMNVGNLKITSKPESTYYEGVNTLFPIARALLNDLSTVEENSKLFIKDVTIDYSITIDKTLYLTFSGTNVATTTDENLFSVTTNGRLIIDKNSTGILTHTVTSGDKATFYVNEGTIEFGVKGEYADLEIYTKIANGATNKPSTIQIDMGSTIIHKGSSFKLYSDYRSVLLNEGTFVVNGTKDSSNTDIRANLVGMTINGGTATLNAGKIGFYGTDADSSPDDEIGILLTGGRLEINSIAADKIEYARDRSHVAGEHLPAKAEGSWYKNSAIIFIDNPSSYAEVSLIVDESETNKTFPAFPHNGANNGGASNLDILWNNDGINSIPRLNIINGALAEQATSNEWLYVSSNATEMIPLGSVNPNDRTIKEISIENNNRIMFMMENGEIVKDYTGINLTAYLNNEEIETINLSDTSITITFPETITAGTAYQADITYSGKTCKLDFVALDSLTGVTFNSGSYYGNSTIYSPINEEPFKNEYISYYVTYNETEYFFVEKVNSSMMTETVDNTQDTLPEGESPAPTFTFDSAKTHGVDVGTVNIIFYDLSLPKYTAESTYIQGEFKINTYTGYSDILVVDYYNIHNGMHSVTITSPLDSVEVNESESDTILPNVAGRYYIEIMHNGERVTGTIYIYDTNVTNIKNAYFQGNTPPDMLISQTLTDYLTQTLLDESFYVEYFEEVNGIKDETITISSLDMINTSTFENSVGQQKVIITFANGSFEYKFDVIPDFSNATLLGTYNIDPTCTLGMFYEYTAIKVYDNGYGQFMHGEYDGGIISCEIEGSLIKYLSEDFGGYDYLVISGANVTSYIPAGVDTPNDTYYYDMTELGMPTVLQIKVLAPVDSSEYTGNDYQLCWAVAEMDMGDGQYFHYCTIQVQVDKANNKIKAMGNTYDIGLDNVITISVS